MLVRITNMEDPDQTDSGSALLKSAFLGLFGRFLVFEIL